MKQHHTHLCLYRNYFLIAILALFFCVLKMNLFLLLVFIPSLITADILCPNSKTTCPEDKQCCEVDGEYSCCDLDDDQDTPARRLRVFPGAELKSSTTFKNTTPSVNGTILHYGTCDLLSCRGTCCSNSWDGCCEYSLASCCNDNSCCPTSNKCCKDGCCEFMTDCCGDGCCDNGYNCCETWCCKKGYKCGLSFMTCRNKGISISPEIITLLFLAASVFVSYRH